MNAKANGIEVKLHDLHDYLEANRVADISWDRLDKLTSAVIIDDNYELIASDIQDMVELLDSPDLNKIDETDRLKALVLLSKF
jgi:hypothetical protein